jgi:hypothetical protein
MSKASPIQTSFNAGELSPALDGRVDLGKYASGCSVLENFIPLIQGPALRRSGTRFVNAVKNSANRTWLVRFEFSQTQAYILEFGDRYIRFYTNQGQLLFSTPSAWATSTSYIVGDLVRESGVNYYATVNHTSGTFSTDLAAGRWYALTDNIYEIPSPYTAADLINANNTFKLRYVQSGDVVYFVHPDYPPQKLSRFAPTIWTMTDVQFVGGPFEDLDPDSSITVYASAQTGSVTLISSAGIFSSSDVGALFLLEQKAVDDIQQWEVGKTISAGDRRRSDGKTYEALNGGTTGSIRPTHSFGAVYDGGIQWQFRDPGYGWVKITAFTSSTQVSATVESRLPAGAVGSGNPTNRWAFSRWSSGRGWPNQIAFFRERLVFATDQIIDMSVAADFENFSDRNFSGEVTAEQAIAIQISSDQVNTIEWLAPSDGLVIGTTGGEFVAQEVTLDEPLGPGNVKITQQSLFGSKSVLPALVGDVILFIQRAGKKVRELQFEFSQNGYKSSDLTVLADHVTGSGVIDLAYQQEPHNILWAVRDDGQLLGFTYNREQDVLGWHRHTIGNGEVESIQHIPNPDGSQDDLWMIVKRTIDGQTTRYIEFLEKDFAVGDDTTDAFFVDSGLSYSGTATTTLSGLDHLEGETVQVLVNGAAHPDRVVETGAITLQEAATTASVGLGYESKLRTMRIESGAQDGTAQGKTKRITKVVFRFLNTLGAQAGPAFDNTDTITFRKPSDPMGQPPALFTGDKLVEWPNGYDFEGYVAIKQDQPLPMTVIAIMPQVVTQDR